LNAGEAIAREHDAAWRDLSDHVIMAHKTFKHTRLAFEHGVVICCGSLVNFTGQPHLPTFRIWLDFATGGHGGHLYPPAASIAWHSHLVSVLGQLDLTGNVRVVRVINSKVAAGPDYSGIFVEVFYRRHVHTGIAWKQNIINCLRQVMAEHVCVKLPGKFHPGFLQLVAALLRITINN
jgi:hypothetical protein